ncbi:MAG: hypothetical protein GY931_11965 [Maribacter sp.]|nr:hypothetical protein [Maribacter sp.]
MTKFVILATQRTGSTFVRLWLNNNSNVRCHGEIFIHSGIDGFKEYCKKSIDSKILYTLFSNKMCAKLFSGMFLNKFIKDFCKSVYFDSNHPEPWVSEKMVKIQYRKKNYTDIKAIGFKLMYAQLLNHKVLKSWLRDNNIKIIYITRNNILKIYISRLMLDKYGIAHSVEKTHSKTIHVNPNKILSELDKIAKTSEQMRSVFPKNKCLEITYEDIFFNYVKTAGKIWEFLDLEDNNTPKPPLKKITSDSMKQVIENYDEILNVLSGTPYEVFLQ